MPRTIASLRYCRDGPILALVQDAGYRGKLKDIAAAVLLDYAIASNPSGIVLISMYTPRHLAFNLSRLTDAPAPDVVLDLVHRLGVRGESD